MKLSLMFANAGPFVLPDHFANLVVTAEHVGFESVLAIDHVVVPQGYESRYPYDVSGRMPGNEDTPMAEPLVSLAYAAALTREIRLGTGVLVLPQRNPAVVAKQVATLDVLSGGRAMLGVGIGWLREEFDALGVPFESRAKRTEEAIGAIRSLWRPEAEAFSGSCFEWAPVHCEPRPVQPGGVPIHVGGHVAAAARRAARIADGYFPLGVSDDVLDLLLGALREECAAISRDPGELEITVGPVAADLDSIRRLEDRGIDRVVMLPPAFDPEGVRKGLDDLGDRILRHV